MESALVKGSAATLRLEVLLLLCNHELITRI
jgi:hypothetical protein